MATRTSVAFRNGRPEFNPQEVEEEFSLDVLRSVLEPLTAADLLRILHQVGSLNKEFEQFRADGRRRDASALDLQGAVYDLHETLQATGLNSRRIPAPEDAYEYLASSVRERSTAEGWYEGATTLEQRVERTLDRLDDPEITQMRGYIGARAIASAPNYTDRYSIAD